MDKIRKYSREWFAGNDGMQDKQKEALKNMQKGCEAEPDLFSILNKKTFIGEKDTVKKQFYNRDYKTSGDSSLIYKYGGIDSLFDLIDADGNGTVTEEEVNDVMSIDSEEMGMENRVFSTRDLRTIYENAMAAEGAVVEKDDFVDKYTYKDGMFTEIYKDEDGSIISKYIEKDLENNERIGTQYNYFSQIQCDIIKDEKGRMRFAEVKSHKSKAENSKTTTEYIDDKNKKIVTKDTAGRTIVETYDGEKLVKTKQTLKYNSDGVIDETYQQSIGDCWVLAGVNALNDTVKGRKILKDSIQQNSDGSVTVELRGVDRKYTYTPEQIGACEYSSKNKMYAIGDIDMNLIEMAIGDYRKELLSDPENLEKTEFSDSTPEDPLNGGYTWSTIEYLTGKKAHLVFEKPKMEEIISKKQRRDDGFVMAVDFKNEDFEIGDILVQHAYSISRVTKDNVYVVNPHDSTEEIKYPKDKFLQNANIISFVDFK